MAHIDLSVDGLRPDVVDVARNHLPEGERCWYGHGRVEAPATDGWVGRRYSRGC